VRTGIAAAIHRNERARQCTSNACVFWMLLQKLGRKIFDRREIARDARVQPSCGERFSGTLPKLGQCNRHGPNLCSQAEERYLG
jgi:hypothetical protein